MKNKYFLFVSFAALFLFGGCATTILSDDRITDETAGALGMLPNDITIENRRTKMINTYYTVKTKDGKEFRFIRLKRTSSHEGP
jgi:hypothetical protein